MAVIPLILAFALTGDLAYPVEGGVTPEFLEAYDNEIDVAGHTLEVTMPEDSWRGVTFRGTRIGNSSKTPGRLIFGSRNTKYHLQTKTFTGGAGNVLDVQGGAWLYIQDEIEPDGCWTLRVGDGERASFKEHQPSTKLCGGWTGGGSRWPGPVKISGNVTIYEKHLELAGPLSGGEEATLTVGNGSTLRLGSKENTFKGKVNILGGRLELLAGAKFSGLVIQIADGEIVMDGATKFDLPCIKVMTGDVKITGGAPGTTIAVVRKYGSGNLTLDTSAKVTGGVIYNDAKTAQGRTCARALFERLKKVGESDKFIWAWAQEWVCPLGDDGGECPRYRTPAGKLTGRAPRLAMYELAEIARGPISRTFAETFQYVTAEAIRTHWRACQGVPIFTWHADNPYWTKESGEKPFFYKDAIHPDVVHEIVAEKGPARAWYAKSLTEIANFLNCLVDDDGRRIPVIYRYPHENDGGWFWWGKGHCSADDYIALCRLTNRFLKKKCGDDAILFAYTPTGEWPDEAGLLERYPGDEFCDVIGVSEYGIEKGETDEEVVRHNADALRRARTLTKVAKERNLIACFAEAGCGNSREAHYWDRVLEIMTAPDVHLAWIATWGGSGTYPDTEEGRRNLVAFVRDSRVLTISDKKFQSEAKICK